MNASEVRIVLTSTSRLRQEISGGERKCCIDAERVIREWYLSGWGITLEIQTRETEVRARVHAYLADVSVELKANARVDHAAWPGS